MDIIRASSLTPNKGTPENFNGSVAVTQLFKSNDELRASAGSVTFQPGARSRWHTHPRGQLLVVTAGSGWVQEWGGEKQEIHAGDVVWTPPGVKHWHGGSAATSLTHIAIQESAGGKAVEWLEPVTEEQYLK